MIYDASKDGPAKVIDRSTGQEVVEVVWADTDKGEYSQWWRDQGGCLVLDKAGLPIRRKRRGYLVVFLLVT
jgi:hypothetical protein